MDKRVQTSDTDTQHNDIQHTDTPCLSKTAPKGTVPWFSFHVEIMGHLHWQNAVAKKH